MNMSEALEAAEKARDNARTRRDEFRKGSHTWCYWNGRLDMAQAMIMMLEPDEDGD